MKEHIEYLERHFPNHINLAITVKIITCLDYIKENIEDITSVVGTQKLFYHPDNHMAVSLDYSSPKKVRDLFLKLHSEVEQGLVSLQKIDDEVIRNCIITSFLNGICDSKNGRMEERLRSALVCLNDCCPHFSLLMFHFWREIQTNPNALAVLDFFADKVEGRLPVKYLDGLIRPITWLDIGNFFTSMGWETFDE